MKRKKGFTLIELLAVIVILAIIALIATPLVLKYIEYSKEKSAKLSANTYAEAVEKEYASKLISNEKMSNKEYTVKELEELGVKVKGTKPEDGTVTLQNGNVIKYTLTINDYVITYENGNITVTPEKDTNANSGELLDHTVKFMVDGELYEITSVKSGNSIKEPDSPLKDGYKLASWNDSEGNVVSFPITPTEDMIISALLTENIAQALIESLGYNYEEYPYVYISIGEYKGSQTYSFKCFSQLPVASTTDAGYLSYAGKTFYTDSSYNYFPAGTNVSDIESVINGILKEPPAIKEWTYLPTNELFGSMGFANFDFDGRSEQLILF